MTVSWGMFDRDFGQRGAGQRPWRCVDSGSQGCLEGGLVTARRHLWFAHMQALS